MEGKIKTMENNKDSLNQFGLTPDNSIVVGSGILSALQLRKSNDIDVIATEEKYKELSSDNHFKEEYSHGRYFLSDGLFEISTGWTIVGKRWDFNSLLDESTIIDGVRYNTVEFLLNAKSAWVKNGEERPKDVADIKLMEAYLSSIKQ